MLVAELEKVVFCDAVVGMLGKVEGRTKLGLLDVARLCDVVGDSLAGGRVEGNTRLELLELVPVVETTVNGGEAVWTADMLADEVVLVELVELDPAGGPVS